MVLGEYKELYDERECDDAMKAFADRRLYLKISESTLLPGTNEQEANMQLIKESRPAIYRIVIDEKNGRYENEQGF